MSRFIMFFCQILQLYYCRSEKAVGDDIFVDIIFVVDFITVSIHLHIKSLCLKCFLNVYIYTEDVVFTAVIISY